MVVPPSEVGDAVSIALFAATVAVVVVVVTAVHRWSTVMRPKT